MNEISIKTGHEGPRHDPYAYTEVTVDGRNGEVVYHEGLGEWTQCGELCLEGYGARELFASLTGITPEVAIKAAEEIDARRVRDHFRHCKGRIEEVAGYPGETLDVCECGEILNAYFNESAII